MARTTRLFTLLQSLRGKHHPVTAAALASDLGISERTVYRDIAELIAQGAPIYGEAGIGYVLRPGLFLPPLMLSEDEAEAIMLGLRYVAQRGDVVLERAAREALSKIAAVLPPSARAIIDDPAVFPGPNGSGFPENAVDLGILRAGIKAQAKLRIVYQDARGARTERIVWPIALGFLNTARILVARCELRQAYRSFRTDRIAEALNTGDRYPGRRAALLAALASQMKLEESVEFAPDGG